MHVIGDDDGVGFGVQGTCSSPRIGKGVEGVSDNGDGVFGQTRARRAAGLHGVHTATAGFQMGFGVLGELNIGIAAVKGQTGGGSGVGSDVSGSGVWGDSSNGNGVSGTSSGGPGVYGEATGDGTGVFGYSAGTNGSGVVGNNNSTNALGILAGRERVSNNTAGVYGESDHAGVYGHDTANGTGVFGHSAGSNGSGVVG